MLKKEVKRIISKSERIPIDTKEHNIVIAYISAHLIYSKGQRYNSIHRNK